MCVTSDFISSFKGLACNPTPGLCTESRRWLTDRLPPPIAQTGACLRPAISNAMTSGLGVTRMPVNLQAFHALLDPLADGAEGAHCPLPKNPVPISQTFRPHCFPCNKFGHPSHKNLATLPT